MKKLLYVGEASYMNTGYGVYAKELLSLLHASGKYEIAELGGYATDGDPRNNEVPWKFYANAPAANSPEVEKYYGHTPNQFGKFRFEQTCLDFKPDIVFSIRDVWMDAHLHDSPLRPFYYLVTMPTIDSEPQDEISLAYYTQADGLLTYTDWGGEVVKRQCGHTINYFGAAPAGVNLDDFQVIADKSAHKESCGIRSDALILGTVMRNQKRKLFPDLMEGFAKFLKSAPADISKRSYLYMHTGYPDIGWNLPRLMKELGITHKCIFTYQCKNCKTVFPSLYQDARNACKNCGRYTCVLPTVDSGLTRKALANVINLFDVYVQYALNEGLGMCQLEAAACGVPVMSVNYSAMEDVLDKLGEGAIPINVQRFTRECESHAYKAHPDNEDFVEKLLDLFAQPDILRMKLGEKAREAVERFYRWEDIAIRWEKVFDSMPKRELSETWNSPSRLHSPAKNLPANLSTEDFVRWAIVHIAGKPELLDSFFAMRLARDLTWGTTRQDGDIFYNDFSLLGAQGRWTANYTREDAAQMLYRIGEEKNHWERLRLQAVN